MTRRSRARDVALQVLYQDDLNPWHSPAEADAFLRSRLHAPELVEFARSLVDGVRRNRQELDQLLAQTADNWSLERMAATDRNVLRLGAFEILYSGTPDRVAINEAVELAKRFGAKQSAQFVNGILDRLLAGHEKPRNQTNNKLTRHFGYNGFKHGFVRQDQARSEKDQATAQYRRPRPVQGRGTAGRRRLPGGMARDPDQDRHGRPGGRGNRGRNPHPVPGPRRRNGRRAGNDQVQAQDPHGPGRGADQIRRERTDRDHGGGGQRGRQNHVHRQAGPDVHRPGQEGGAGRRRHVPRRGRRAVDHLGQRLGAQIVTGPPGQRPGQRRPSGRRGGHRDRAPTCASSTRPAGCKPSRT